MSTAAAPPPSSVGVASSSSYVPPQIDRHFQTIHFNKGGELLLGCSSLTSRYWIGSLWLYADPHSAPAVNKCKAGVELDNGIGHAVLLDDKQFLVGLDDGSVEHYVLSHSGGEEGVANKGDEGVAGETNKEKNFLFLEKTAAVLEHNDLVSGMALTAKQGSDLQLITSSYDRSLVVHDAWTLAKRRDYSNAHQDLINDVDTSNNDPNVFASAGQDGKVALWDLRNDKPTSIIQSLESNVPWTSLQFLPLDDNCLLIGGAAGQVSLYDLRKHQTHLFSQKLFELEVYKFAFSQQRKNVFAACADSVLVKALEIDPSKGFTQRYSDSRHTDYVRGLAWNPQDDTLWSCGWDKTLLHHKVQ